MVRGGCSGAGDGLTVLLILPLIKITGSAIPKATLETRGAAERIAGDLTSEPTKA